MTKKVFIFGEDGFTNLTLAHSLSMQGLDVIGETDNENLTLNFVSQHHPDVTVLNLDFGHTKAINLAVALRKRYPELGIVITCKTTDIRLLGIDPKDLPIGVVIVRLAKHSDLDNLKDAIISSTDFVSAKVELNLYEDLSEVQVETFRLMAEGKANSEIAKLRFVSEKSVEQMLARIAISMGLDFDRKHNQRVRLTNTYYELISGRR
ncbi:MAG: hypothetical protein ACKOCL_01145 [Candidatus Nanopelagicaceae bacterium]